MTGGEMQPNGSRVWRVNSDLHRADGPAVIAADGREEWWLNGHRHRADGPAITSPHECWYIEGTLVDVTRWSQGTERSLHDRMRQAEEGDVNVREMNNRMVDMFRFNFGSEANVVLFTYVKHHADAAMLLHQNFAVQAVAAWHHPVDETYMNVAVHNPTVNTFMRYRPDVPEHVRTLMDVMT